MAVVPNTPGYSSQRAAGDGNLSRIKGWIRLLWLGKSRADAPMGNPVGRTGEATAARFLRREGFRVLARGVRTKHGEADLVCLDPDGRTIVLVEVKSRRYEQGSSIGGRAVPPEAAVTERKRRTLRAVARALVNRNGWKERPLRIDVVAVEFDSSRKRPAIRHHRGAV